MLQGRSLLSPRKEVIHFLDHVKLRTAFSLLLKTFCRGAVEAAGQTSVPLLTADRHRVAATEGGRVLLKRKALLSLRAESVTADDVAQVGQS